MHDLSVLHQLLAVSDGQTDESCLLAALNIKAFNDSGKYVTKEATDIPG